MHIVSLLYTTHNTLAYFPESCAVSFEKFRHAHTHDTHNLIHADTLVNFRPRTICHRSTHYRFPAAVTHDPFLASPLHDPLTHIHTHPQKPTNLPRCLSPSKPSDLIAPAAFLGCETVTVTHPCH